jgi:hypothetical protein
MGADKQDKKTNKVGGGPTRGAPPTPTDAPAEETSETLDPEEAKRRAFRKLKPVGPVMKPLTPEEIDAFRNDPELKERDHLLDAMAKGPEQDDFDPSNP